MSKLLFNEHPLVILPELAVRIGLNEAIVLQQIHYWLQKSEHLIESRAWVYNSVEEWAKQFPFFSPSTVRRTLEKLTADGYLITGCFNKMRMDKTKWYTIDYERLESDQNLPFVNSADRSAQIEQMDQPTLSSPSVQTEQMDSSNLSKPIPETTQKLQQETTTTTNTAGGDDGQKELKLKNVGDLPWFIRSQWGAQGNIGYDKFTGPDGLNAIATSIGLEEMQKCIELVGEVTPDKRCIRYLKGTIANRAKERAEASQPAPSKQGDLGHIEFVCDTCSTQSMLRIVDLQKNRGRTFGCPGCDTKYSVDKYLEGV
jgi:hypothetical protein